MCLTTSYMDYGKESVICVIRLLSPGDHSRKVQVLSILNPLPSELAEKFADIVEPHLGHSETSIVATVRILSPAHDVMTLLAIFADRNVTILKDCDRGRH